MYFFFFFSTFLVCTSIHLMPFNFYNLKFYNFLIPKFTFLSLCPLKSTLAAQMVKNSPAMQETLVQYLGWEDPLAKGMATQSIVLPGEFHGQTSLAGYSPWGRKESDKTEWLLFLTFINRREVSHFGFSSSPTLLENEAALINLLLLLLSLPKFKFL